MIDDWRLAIDDLSIEELGKDALFPGP